MSYDLQTMSREENVVLLIPIPMFPEIQFLKNIILRKKSRNLLGVF